MPYEMPKREEGDMIKPEPTPEQDLVMKVLIDSGISELELNIHTIESNNIIAKEGLLSRAKLAEDRASQEVIENEIAKNEVTIQEGHRQLIELYKNLTRTIDKRLLPALRQHLISGLPKVLTPDERKDVLETLRDR